MYHSFPVPRPLADYNRWNWTDTAAVVERRHVLTSNLRRMLEDRRETVRSFPQRFNRPGQDCFANSLILVLGHYTDAGPVCACTLRYAGRRCGRWQVCSYCSYQRERAVLDRYRSATADWRRGCSVTIHANVSTLPFFDADPLVIEDGWDRLHAVAYDLVRRGALRGLWWGEHFAPRFHVDDRPGAFCWPHLHGFGVLADGVTAADVAHGVDAATVFCRPLGDEAHAKNLLDYVVTVPPFAAAYRAGWAAVGAVEGEPSAARFNHVVAEVVGAFEDSSQHRWRTRAAGVMHHRHRGYVGATRREVRRRGGSPGTRAWLQALNTRSDVDLSLDG